MSIASSGARGLKAKFESMAEDKKKKEEEEKSQQMAKKQQERKALVKISHKAQPPAATVEEPAVPAPLPKRISAQVSAWCSGIQIRHKQEPKGSKSLVENKAQASPVLSKCYIYVLSPPSGTFHSVLLGLIYTRMLEWARFSQYNRSLTGIVQWLSINL